MIPIWAISGIAAGVISASAAWYGRGLIADATEATLKATHAQAQTDALVEQAKTFNAKMKAMEAALAQTKMLRDAFAVDAGAANTAAGRLDRRMRDQQATSDLAFRSAIDTATTAGQREAAAEAANLCRGLLERNREDARRISLAAIEAGADADNQFSAASECGRLYEIAR